MTPQLRGRRKRGRPKKVDTMVTSVRVPQAIYDRYCSLSRHTEKDVRAIMREVLTLHAPIVIFCSPKIPPA
jgi:hypothetical protein